MKGVGGLLSVLFFLIVILVPGPTEAVIVAPMLTLQSDLGTPISITVSQYTCGTLGSPDTGYNQCFTIPNNTYGAWSLNSISTSNPARLLVSDNASGLDLFSLTGTKLQPMGEGTHTLALTFTDTFNNPSQNAGTFQWALRAGGYFQALTGNNVGNNVTFSGLGNFGQGSITTPLGNTLTYTVPGTSTGAFVAFQGMTQTSPYPAFNCDFGSFTCSPTIQQTLSLTGIRAGVLTFLTNSPDGAGGNCSFDYTGAIGMQVPASNCDSLSTINTQISAYFTAQQLADDAAFAAAAVPEPSSVLLLGSGLVGLAGWARKRASKKA